MTTQLTIPTTLETLLGTKTAPPDMVNVHSSAPHHYKIGPVSVTIQSELAGIETAFYQLYKTYQVDMAAVDEFHIEVVAKRSWRSLRRYFHIIANGEDLFAVKHESSVLPHVELALNTMIIRHLPGYYQIHASVMSLDGVGVVFPGSPGQGKSTLAAALLARGWSYLSDEFALIDSEKIILTPFPKTFCLKARSFEALTAMGLPLDLGREYHKGQKGRIAMLDPLRVRRDAVADPCPVGMIIFPQFGQGAEPAIEPMPRAQAVFELARVSFNFSKFRAKGFDLLADIVQQAHCYTLRTGDLSRTCELVETCFRQVEAIKNCDASSND